MEKYQLSTTISSLKSMFCMVIICCSQFSFGAYNEGVVSYEHPGVCWSDTHSKMFLGQHPTKFIWQTTSRATTYTANPQTGGAEVDCSYAVTDYDYIRQVIFFYDGLNVVKSDYPTNFNTGSMSSGCTFILGPGSHTLGICVIDYTGDIECRIINVTVVNP
jgi:hypothetical protein